MTPQQFIQEAELRLDKDPMRRLSPLVQAALNSNKFIFDTHCHIFDRGCIDESYFLLRFMRESIGLEGNSTSEDAKLFTQKALKKKGLKALTQSEEEIYEGHKNGQQYDWEAIEEEIKKAVQDAPPLEGFSVGGLWRTMRNIVFKKDMRGILEYYLERVAIRNLPKHSDKTQITSILLMDLELGWNKAIDKNLRAQMLEVKGLMKDFPLLPYIAVDPRRATWNGEDNLYRLVLEALTGDMPFFGIKVYPSLGYMPSDERLAPIFEVCERFSIPVLTHCGGNVISTFQNPIMVMEGTQARQIVGEKQPGLTPREDVAYQLNDPANWQPVLERFPKLKLNLGHFGGDFIWENYPRRDAQNRLEVILKMMEKYEYLYADFSFNLIDDKTYDNFKKVLKENAVARNRALFGTDFWVVMPNGNLAQAQEEFSRILGVSLMNRMLIVNPHKHLFTKVPLRVKPPVPT